MDTKLVEKLKQGSYLTDGNFAYIEALYDDFLKDPSSVSDYWSDEFTKLQQSGDNIDTPLSDVRSHFIHLAKLNGSAAVSVHPDITHERREVKLNDLIKAYQAHGHHHAKLDPLNMAVRKTVPDLSLASHGFSEKDSDIKFKGFNIGSSDDTLGGIYQALKKTYASSLGVEFTHISNQDETKWIQQRLEAVHSHPKFSKAEKERILEQLTAAEGLEKYLGSKYVGQKRFSLEGGVSLIPMLDELVQRAGVNYIKEVVIGMAHRGRLNVLVNILGKSPERLFQEFEGKTQDNSHSGDVKYHMGFSSNIKTRGSVVHLALAFNPSHLEIINPVVEGSVRARQERRGDVNKDDVIPVLIHGDAAVAGQGVVAETFNFSQARGFNTGGTVHIVVNNQIGFTTSNPLDSRSTLYCTDVAKMVQAPVFHVNGDDPEACVFAMQLALDYRMRFKKDVMVDLVCYRRHGHNEADEPSTTQPLMYRKIKALARTREIYAQSLIKSGSLTQEQSDAQATRYRNCLDAGKAVVDLVPKSTDTDQLAVWEPFFHKAWDQKVNTAITKTQFNNLSKAITNIPEHIRLQAQVKREYDLRKKMLQGELPLNWGFCELMAYASLLTQDFNIRLCGQDSGRGTFSHRHSVLHDYETGESYIPLQHIDSEQKSINIIDSVLSEEAVLGFEYGYSTTEPNVLDIWEAQFGDFANGAQVVIDQFISSGWQKWGRLCGLVMYLPHGYEGQGPEHSSARLERYLQLCAQNNMQVCVPSTPAQMFHMVRRQMIRAYRKPLIVMTPKSLLRHKMAVSSIEDLTKGSFQCVIPEVKSHDIKKITRIVLCSGKVYYDVVKMRDEKEINNTVIIRIEQLYPFPVELLTKELAKYANAIDIVWCQEEPQNQGAWYALQHHFLECMNEKQKLSYAGRAASASPATGYTKLHLEQQDTLVKQALDLGDS